MVPKILAYLVILCFEMRCPKQKYYGSPEVKHFAPPNFGLATPLCSAKVVSWVKHACVVCPEQPFFWTVCLPKHYRK